MPADFPYERDIDAAALEKRAAEHRRAERRMALKSELRRAASVMRGERRRPDEPPLTERAEARFSVGERALIEATAHELGISVRALLRGAALAYARRLEGRL